ncbi:N-acetylglucosamine-1-phosphotransferase subunit gamma-like [Tubulanus polymorphus]|uniref:N-acetylglucosamine-1-phosphotransferase subunit gamma-like n=1 Tax=Tubulanus polymorphus TaxID=672921 RepID=UPI003DA2B785
MAAPIKVNFFATNFVIFVVLSGILLSAVYSSEVTMKIIDGQSVHGIQNFNQMPDMASQAPALRMRIKPANFSGPLHLKRLQGKCFSKIEQDYKYEFCPFSNVTQHEQSLRWNPYSGILGVWQEWEIDDNKFVAMKMLEGDACGLVHRSVRVLFVCAEKNVLAKVTEPKTCQYELVFRTPLVCHNHSMLIYPTLSPENRLKWDYIEGEYTEKLITKKGYNRYLRSLFESVGFCLPESKRSQLADVAQKNDEDNKRKEAAFETLPKCIEEYQKLRTEIDGLRTLLQLNEIQNTNTVETINK